LEGLARLEGGAKQTLHYTDVSPDVVFLAVTRGGNHIFGHIFGTDEQDHPILKVDALEEALRVHSDDILSDIYVGWVGGFLDGERNKLQAALGEAGALAGKRVYIAHPRQAFAALTQALQENTDWLA
ncbi:MAG: type I-B CRISPR-associated protein Cas7/Cst2/DevR, partial [Caldilineae bacterium]